MKVMRYLLPILGIFLALGIGLYFVNPYAPLLLLASLILQAPVVYFIARFSYGGGYQDRLHARQVAYEEDGDAQGWLDKERKEAESFGYRLLSAKARAQNALLRAELQMKTDERDGVAELLDEIELGKLNPEDKKRYYDIKKKWSMEQPLTK